MRLLEMLKQVFLPNVEELVAVETGAAIDRGVERAVREAEGRYLPLRASSPDQLSVTRTNDLDAVGLLTRLETGCNEDRRRRKEPANPRRK